MSERHQHAPKTVCSLADHLDTVLASLEDLLAIGSDTIEPRERLRLELTVITHVLQARHLILDIAFDHPDLIEPFTLLLEGTAALEAKTTDTRPTPSESITPEYLIGRRISVGMLDELASTLLDALNRNYVFYENDDEDGQGEPAQAPSRTPPKWWQPSSLITR